MKSFEGIPMRHWIAAAFIVIATGSTSHAQTIYPIDRAEILVGSRFDLKVEFSGLANGANIALTVNGEDHAKALGRAADVLVERVEDKDMSAMILREVVLNEPGTYRIKVTDGVNTKEVTWNVYSTGPRAAKNVILFVGDGMSLAHRVGARLLSKGIAEGKTFGKLAMDDMPQMALVQTAGADSIITDSANSASAYATGHKSSVNAMGVYADRTESAIDDPKVENIASLVKRRLNLAVGVVTNTEVWDATPAAMLVHTRKRSTHDQIVEQFFAAKPDVLMGGGSGSFRATRADGVDYVARFRDEGYTFVANATELAASHGAPKLLGLFNKGTLDGVLDRKFLKGGTVKEFSDQPDLTDQLRASLEILSRQPNGFFLMVESGLIDRYTHRLDMDRAVYETIMLDNAVKIARDWSAARGDDTLILVLADHTHPVSMVGTINDDMSTIPNVPMRERVGNYEKAGFPNYQAADKEGYPPVDATRRLAIFSAASPDYCETFRPKLDGPNDPTTEVAGKDPKDPKTYIANERYCDQPGAMRRLGNITKYLGQGVHSGEDVVLTAAGPGSERVRGAMDNTEVFRVMVEALGLGHNIKTGQVR